MPAIAETESRLLDQYIDLLLQSLLEGTIDQTEARNSLRKAIALVDIGNSSIAFFLESEIRALLDQGGRLSS